MLSGALGDHSVSNENAREIFKTLRTAQEKHTYFLLAAAGAAIGLAVSQTRDSPLAWPQIPLGIAVVSWGLSFFSGCRYADYVAATLYANAELVRVQSGLHPKAGSNPEIMGIASEGILEAIEGNNKRASRFARWQFRFLVIGAILYVVWHVLEMYLHALR